MCSKYIVYLSNLSHGPFKRKQNHVPSGKKSLCENFNINYKWLLLSLYVCFVVAYGRLVSCQRWGNLMKPKVWPKLDSIDFWQCLPSYLCPRAIPFHHTLSRVSKTEENKHRHSKYSKIATLIYFGGAHDTTPMKNNNRWPNF